MILYEYKKIWSMTFEIFILHTTNILDSSNNVLMMDVLGLKKKDK